MSRTRFARTLPLLLALIPGVLAAGIAHATLASRYTRAFCPWQPIYLEQSAGSPTLAATVGADKSSSSTSYSRRVNAILEWSSDATFRLR